VLDERFPNDWRKAEVTTSSKGKKFIGSRAGIQDRLRSLPQERIYLIPVRQGENILENNRQGRKTEKVISGRRLPV